MMHPDFIKDDERFSDRETTDREDYLLFNEENVMKEPKMITKTMYVHAHASCSKDDDGIRLHSCDMSSAGYAFLGEVEVTFPMPDKDPVTAQVESLESCIQSLQADTHAKVTAMKEKIQSLLAIGHQV